MINKTELFIFGTRPSDLGFSEPETTPPAHERIGNLFAQIIQENDLEKSIPHLEALGLHPKDSIGLARAHRLVMQLKTAKITVHSEAINAPIFKVTHGDTTVGLFKLGRKRAAMELLARKVAFVTGLAEHTIPGVFCALGNHHHVKEWEDAFEELWNGRLKIYSDEPKTDDFLEKAIVGILEPFDPTAKTESLEEFAKMTLLALILGLRDAKEDGYSGSTWFDVEDVFPIRLAPPTKETDHVAATDLPYLSDPKATEPLGPEIFKNLRELVESWTLKDIRSILEAALIDYADTKAEDSASTDPNGVEALIDRSDTDREDTELNDPDLDEGNNAIALELPAPPHAINGVLNHWDIKQNPNHFCLLQNQIKITLERITLIQQFFLSDRSSPCLLDLVFHVDSWAKKYAGYCDHLLRTPNSPIKREAESALVRGSPMNLIGRRIPSSIATPHEFEHWLNPIPLNTSFRDTPKSS